MSILPGPMGIVMANQFLLRSLKFRDFPWVRQTKAGWLIGTYDDLRSFVTKMKSDVVARDRFWADLQEHKHRSMHGERKVLIRCGRRDDDNLYDLQGSMEAFQDKTRAAQAPKIGQRVSSEQQARAILQKGEDHIGQRAHGTAHSRLDKNLRARITDIDSSGDYHDHWSRRQFETHHIVEDSLAAMKEAKARFTCLTRGNSLSVLVSAELHQRFFTSGLATKMESGTGPVFAERDRLNQAKTREAFERAYHALYADTMFQDLREIAFAIIESVFGRL